MELKEQLSTIEETLIMFGLENEAFRSIILAAIEAYGKNCYNAALDKAADEVSLIIDGHKRSATIQLGNSFISVNSQSILTLKKH